MSVLGTSLLCFVLVASLVAVGAWTRACWTAETSRGAVVARAGRWCSLAALAGTAAAVALVEFALVRHDTTLNYATMTTSPAMPTYYRVTALWSALEGSLLLWLLVLAGVMALALRSLAPVLALRAHAIVGLVLSSLTAAFTVVVLLASPFTVTDAAVAARPSPLLQDHVAMGIHPPLLYGGFLSLAVPYALAISGLVTMRMDAMWAAHMRRWALVSWILLTAGIVLGGWWSYAVLGWGGYWAWDPVENASLLPWLVATGLLHTVAPRARAGAWRLWSTGLAGAGFILVLLATFLTRSGVVESIHAFTTSSLGPALLVILIAAAVPWLVLLHRRRRELAEPDGGALLSRGTLLLVNRVLLVLITAVVLVGTLLPTVLEAITGDRLSVGPPWYHRTLAPIALVLLLAMAVGPWTRIRDEGAGPLLHRVRIPAVVAALVLGAVALVFSHVWLAISAGIAAFAVTSLLVVGSSRRGRDRLAVGGWISHSGMALAAVAVLGGGLGTVTQASVSVGETVRTGDMTATVLDLNGRDDGHRSVASASVAVGDGQDFVTVLEPELRWYPTEGTMLAGPQIRTEPLRDVYVTLLDLDEQQGLVTIRLAVTPLVGWIWASTGLMVLGAVVAGWPRRRSAAARRDHRAPVSTRRARSRASRSVGAAQTSRAGGAA